MKKKVDTDTLPDHFKLVSCADCECDLLGESMRGWAIMLRPFERVRYPELVAGRFNERPYCRECWDAIESIRRIEEDKRRANN